MGHNTFYSQPLGGKYMFFDLCNKFYLYFIVGLLYVFS